MWTLIRANADWLQTGRGSDRPQPFVWFIGPDNPDGIPRPDLTAGQYNRHDARLPNKLTGLVTVQHRGHQPRLEAIKLNAWIAQASDTNFGPSADLQNRPFGQSEQIDASRQNILTNFAGANDEALDFKLFQSFPVQQMDLPKVRLSWVACDAGAVLDRCAVMGIAFDAQSGQQAYPHLWPLAEVVGASLTDRFDETQFLSLGAWSQVGTRASGRKPVWEQYHR